MENRSSRNRKGQTGLHYKDFTHQPPAKNQHQAKNKPEKSDYFTRLLFIQTVATATILTVFTVIRLISSAFYGEIDDGLHTSSAASINIDSAAKQVMSYIQTSETFSRLFPSETGKGNGARWTSVILSDTTRPDLSWSEPCICPVDYTQITSDFGKRIDPFSGEIATHNGLDMAVAQGSTVSAAWPGTVRECSSDSIGGNYIIMDHESGMSTYYGHLSHILVESGQTVNAGDHIALSGNTGKSTGPHLHFEITHNGKPVDPADYLDV